MTPDGTPVVGTAAVPGLYLSTGHGTLGWTMAVGSGQVLADIVDGRRTAIETGDLGVARHARAARRPRARLVAARTWRAIPAS